MSPRLHPAEQYARKVLDGRIPACHWIKQACARYFDDKKHRKARGLIFNKDAAQLAIDFIGVVQIPDGGRFILEGWTLFVVWNLFGWYRSKHPRWVIEIEGKREDTSGSRRYREAYLEVARKNIKTSLGAVLGLILAFADGEESAEVYSAATKRDQARICFDDAKRIVTTSDFIHHEGGIEILTSNLSQEHTYSKFEPLSAESKSMDGLRCHGIILDEVHAWKNRETYVKLKRATSARRQPLTIMITTAGKTDESKFCWELHEYSCKVLDGIIEDDTWFSLIYTIDEGDDWADEEVWSKANPYLGISKKWDYMRTEAKRAADLPTALNDFLQYDLNVWVRSDTKWMPMDHWRLNAGPVPAHQMDTVLAGRPCYAGLDLGSDSDLTSFVLEFPPVSEDDPLTYIMPFFFCPEDNILKRAKNDRVPYDLWTDQGWLISTPGNVTDDNFVIHQLGLAMDKFTIKRLYFDRWGSKKIITDLQEELGFTVEEKTHEAYGSPLLVQFGQGFASMSSPMKDMLRKVLKHEYAHGDHPVLTWNMDNLIARSDPAGNIKPDKDKSREKIDGAVALIMAHAGGMIYIPNEGRSVYEDRGIITV